MLEERVDSLAERVGFEPTVGYAPTTVFETVAIDHSATSPRSRGPPYRGHRLALQRCFLDAPTVISLTHSKRSL